MKNNFGCCAFPFLCSVGTNFFWFLMVVLLFIHWTLVPVLLYLLLQRVLYFVSLIPLFFFAVCWPEPSTLHFSLTYWISSLCFLFSCVTFVSNALRNMLKSALLNLFMLSLVWPFASMYHILAMHATSKNVWHFVHVFSLSWVSSHVAMVYSENQSNSYIWSIIWITMSSLDTFTIHCVSYFLVFSICLKYAERTCGCSHVMKTSFFNCTLSLLVTLLILQPCII